MYAIISYKGRQHRVEPGSVLTVDRVSGDPGESINLENSILFAQDEDGEKTGSPTIDNTTVEMEILKHFRDRKITVFKMKRRKSYRRKHGHRQDKTLLRINNITLS